MSMGAEGAVGLHSVAVGVEATKEIREKESFDHRKEFNAGGVLVVKQAEKDPAVIN